MYRCDRNCCICSFVPLEVSYARTIHTFQGFTAGLVDEGKIPNCIVCDPDEKKLKENHLVYFYTALSCGTTLGDDEGIDSAVYFIGSQFQEQHILRSITKLKSSGEDFVLAKKRKNGPNS